MDASKNPTRYEERDRRARTLEAVSRLASGVSHDLGDILTIVASASETFSDALLPARPELREELEDLHRAAQRGTEMVARLSSLSTEQEMELGELDLAQLVRESAGVLRSVLPEGCSLDVEIPPGESYPILGDASAIQQMLLNLTTNARDALSEGGRIAVRVHRIDPDVVGAKREEDAPDVEQVRAEIRLTVSDDGAGMDPFVRDRAFDPFFTTKASGSDSGLGLTVVQALVHRQGGSVEIDSEPERGTEVRLSFPAMPASAPSREGAASPRVLLVEDEVVVRRTGMRVLRRHGFEVTASVDGREALDLLSRSGGDVDLVIADLNMPNLGGRELYERIRAVGRDCPVVITTGGPDSEIRDLMKADPRLHFLPKPWTVGGLVSTIREAVGASGTLAD